MTPSPLPLLLMLAGALAGRTAFLLPAPSLRLLLPPLASLTGLLLGLRLAGTPSLRSLLLSSPGPTPSGKRRCLRLLGWTLPLFLLLQGLQLLLAKLIPPAGETLSPPSPPPFSSPVASWPPAPRNSSTEGSCPMP